MDLEDLVGAHLLIGIPASEPAPEAVERLRATRAGGVILFRPNFASARAFLSLVEGLEQALDRKILMAVDHEGGRVIHLAEGVTVFADNLAAGTAGHEESVRRQGEIEARELTRLGIHLTLAPTLDILTETYSAIIGIRSYGADPDLVARLGAARIRALQAGGVSACAKHFPGLGHSPQDPHHELPVLETSWEELRSSHLKPFVAAIEAGVEAVMTSHPIYPRLDPAGVPATFSKRIVGDLLRRELGFKGLVLSDDLEMGALGGLCSVGEAACRAVEAGHDMVLVCHDGAAQREAFGALLGAAREGRIPRSRLEESAARLDALRSRHAARTPGEPPAADPQGERLARAIARKAVAAARRGKRLPALDRAASACVIFPRLSELAGRIFIEDEMLDEAAYVARILGERGLETNGIVVTALDPSPQDIERARLAASAAPVTLHFCYDAHLYPAARRLLETVQASARQCVVVLLRDPYDEAFVSKAACLNAFGFRRAQIEAVLDALTPGARPLVI